jgi:hypothetical protein
VDKRSLSLAGGLLLALAPVAGAAAAPASGPASVGYADTQRGVEVRLDRAGRFLVITPNGPCSGWTGPITDRWYRARVVGGREGCAVDFRADRRGARGWVVLPAKQYHLFGEYVRFDFDATDARRAPVRPQPQRPERKVVRRAA